MTKYNGVKKPLTPKLCLDKDHINNPQHSDRQHKMYIVLGALFILVFGLAAYFSKNRQKKSDLPRFLYRFWPNLIDSMTGKNILWYIFAIVMTIIIVRSGVDKEVQTFFQTVNPLGQTFAWICLRGGNFWHIGISLIIFGVGIKLKNRNLRIGGTAGIQATLTALLVVAELKFLSGRAAPLHIINGVRHESHFLQTDDPGNFRFDIWNHSFSDARLFWPSGHTATAIAVAAALTAFFPHKRWIPFVAYPLSFMMGTAMIEGDFHWFSDVVAGALIGHIIGWTVGKNFRNEWVRAPELKADPQADLNKQINSI